MSAHPSSTPGLSKSGQQTVLNRKLFRAAAEGDLDAVLHFLGDGADPHFFDDTGSSSLGPGTPLHSAAKNGHLACVKALLPVSNADAPTSNLGLTALMLASMNGCYDCACELVSRSNVLATDFRGNTALIFAAFNGETEIVKILAPLSSLAAVDDEGENASQNAIRRGKFEVASWLVAFEHGRKEREELLALPLAKDKALSAPKPRL